MVIYRTLSEPYFFNTDVTGEPFWGVDVMLSYSEEDPEVEMDTIIFASEGVAWDFYRDVNSRFEPLVIEEE